MSNLTPDRLPPQNLEAERSVLGSMLRENAVIDEISLLLRADSFYLDAHQKIYACILDLHGIGGGPADLVLLHDELMRRQQMEDAGGDAYLAQLWDAAPTAANALYYARIVRDKATHRHIIQVCTEILRDAYEQNQPVADLLASAEQRILGSGELGTEAQTYIDRDMLVETMRRIDARGQAGRQLSGLSTGFEELDIWTAGLQDSELIVLAARPSVGKTALGLVISRNVIQQGQPVFFASLEQSRIELMERLLTSEAGVDAHRLRRGCLSLDDQQRLSDALEALSNRLFHVDDWPAQSVARIAANARRLKRKHGISLVVVDYLQLIAPEDRRAPRHEQVGQISRRLKILARDLRLPVLALAQLNRESESRAGQRPRLSDLRESGAIEQDADTVILLHRPKENEERVDLIIEKQRNGPRGEMTLYFRPHLMRFDETNTTPFET